MAIALKHAAIHEAGHAVLLWLVGWEDNLKWIQMRRIDDGADLAKMKFDRRPPESLSAIRSTLLVLFGGSVASCEHFGRFMRDIDGDWHEAQLAIGWHYPRKLAMRIDNRIGCLDPEADALVRDSLHNANEIVKHSPVKKAIHAVADRLLDATPSSDGFCILPGRDVISICESLVLWDNPFADWIAGN